MPSSMGVSSIEKYRKQASFSSKEMLEIMEPPKSTFLKMKVWSYMASKPEYIPNNKLITSDVEKSETALLLSRFLSSGFFDDVTKMDYSTRTRYLMIVNEAVEMVNPNLSIKIALGISLCANAVLCLGSEKHLKFVDDLWKGKILSCLAITEVAHGSDTKRLKTTATFDHSRNEFILHSPDVGAAKCWVGNLGKQCTHGLVFAQLIVDSVCHGLHPFIVPIRDPDTLTPYPGLTVGDIGEKDGLNGIDNGYILFHHYRIPEENLLDRIGGINEHGEYETSFTDPQRLLGAALESLSAGRVAIMQESSNTLIKAIVIAVRYAVQRLQFSDESGKELPLIEYQTHQWRLFPYVAAAYVFKSFVEEFSKNYINFVAASREGTMEIKQASELVKGVHALVCCTKALITWTTQNAIQEAREACGGHGYHKGAGLGEMRRNHDPRVTFEGDNTVLLQQTSNWLLGVASRPGAVDFSIFPASQIVFLADMEAVLKRRFDPSLRALSEKFIMETFEWLICWLASSTLRRMNKLKATHRDKFLIRSLSQVFWARPLALAFSQYMVLTSFAKKWTGTGPAGAVGARDAPRSVLRTLFLLYGGSCLYHHLPFLLQGGYCTESRLVELLSDSLLGLCAQLKPEVIALTDSLSPPDFVLNSVLGSSDGKMYELLTKAFNIRPRQDPSMSVPMSDASLHLKSKI